MSNNIAVAGYASRAAVVLNGYGPASSAAAYVPHLDPPRNVCFAWKNLLDAATVAASSELSRFPASNLKRQARQKKWITATQSTAYTITLDIDLLISQTVKMIGFIEHNLTPAVTIRIQGNTAPAAWTDTPFDEETTGLEQVTTFGFGGFGEGGFGGTLPDIAGRAQPPRIHFLDYDTNRNIPAYRYWRISFSVDDYAAVPFISIGRVFIGNYFSPTINMLRNFQQTFSDNSEVEKSINDADLINKKKIHSELSMALISRNMSEFNSSFVDMYYNLGIANNFILALEPDTQQGRHYRTFYGRLKEALAIQQLSDDIVQLSLKFKEVL